ncbi:hypothetical protein C1645_737930 [Glomus cerebriforme]|uniref:C2H2-type domain-containing protein n=1 Tax=Glomus cerebriforme TaxID=658196 RepID=A0A397T2Q4_9GLOM|nr:hypothetical protein C1645_737930 [Glomus cerebriforme]
MRKKLDLDNLDLNRAYTKEELKIINNNLKVQTNFENERLIPIPQNPIAKEAIIQEISRQLGNWNIQTGQGGLVTTSQGGFNFSASNRRNKIIAPDIAFTPDTTYITLNQKQLWSFNGQPFTPIFVVEVAVVTSDAILNAIDNRMKNDYFAINTSVKLGWIIDPMNIIWVYKKENNEKFPTRHKCDWDDLDGGNVLPGFTLEISKINDIMLLGDDDEVEEGEKCPYCDSILNSVFNMMRHMKKMHN